MTIQRLATIVGAALLALLTPAAPAHADGRSADGRYDCGRGHLVDYGDYYNLSGWNCLGSGSSQVTVRIFFGDAQGTHFCESVFSWPGRQNLAGGRCSSATEAAE
ncbi:hypothetical protein HII36_42730 [Nonomuraea sp. NN258]|uniref:hypothetical protein n=1 Tax=Nonomuraea antri TaxID=2730852 RepID=UPI00156A4651|nr:hypothetical protein [Nonomuraea antri]NRQ38498.1 hypothetical protein [Nonomuraea antri]